MINLQIILETLGIRPGFVSGIAHMHYYWVRMHWISGYGKPDFRLSKRPAKYAASLYRGQTFSSSGKRKCTMFNVVYYEEQTMSLYIKSV